MVLRYFGIRVTDLDGSLRFYTELLGLKKVRAGRMRHGGRWVLLQDPRSRQRLELNWYPPDSPYSVPYVPGEGLDHIGFRVSDARSVYKKLRREGVPSALAPEDRNGVRGIFYLEDPDGNWIEFYS